MQRIFLYSLMLVTLICCQQVTADKKQKPPETIHGESLPKPLGWTSDYEQIFSDDQVSELDSIIANFEKETTNQIAIVTIDSSWTSLEKFDDFVLKIGNHWGVGQKGMNNGIVIGISTSLRKIRICNGYGIEAKLTDGETKKIIDNTILPEYRKGNYFEGTKKGLLALMQEVR